MPAGLIHPQDFQISHRFLEIFLRLLRDTKHMFQQFVALYIHPKLAIAKHKAQAWEVCRASVHCSVFKTSTQTTTHNRQSSFCECNVPEWARLSNPCTETVSTHQNTPLRQQVWLQDLWQPCRPRRTCRAFSFSSSEALADYSALWLSSEALADYQKIWGQWSLSANQQLRPLCQCLKMSCTSH